MEQLITGLALLHFSANQCGLIGVATRDIYKFPMVLLLGVYQCVIGKLGRVQSFLYELMCAHFLKVTLHLPKTETTGQWNTDSSEEYGEEANFI